MSFHNKYQSIIVVSILIILFLSALSLLVNPSGERGFFRKVALDAIGPLENVVNTSMKGVGTIWNRYIFLVGLEKENRKLREDLSLLRSRINAYNETRLEYGRLKQLMGMRQNLSSPAITAKVVGRERASVFKTVLINRGSLDGLTVGLPVLATEGIVGRIIEVSWNVSTVLLLVDYNSNIDALVQNARAQGILHGSGRKACELKYVQRSEDVRRGDLVVSSGLAGVFPKGLPLGTVISIDKGKTGLFQKIRVVPVVDVSKLEEVLVILKRNKAGT